MTGNGRRSANIRPDDAHRLPITEKKENKYKHELNIRVPTGTCYYDEAKVNVYGFLHLV